MKPTHLLKSFLLALLVALSAAPGKAPTVLETMFSYQGYLSVDGSPANGAYEMAFRLFRLGETAPVGTLSNANVMVMRGVFTVNLDFGAGIFDGTAYELAIAVRERGSTGPLVGLLPRQPLLATPNSVYAQTVRLVPDSALSSNVPRLDSMPFFSAGIKVTTLRVTDSTGGGAMRFGPTDDCSIGIDPVLSGLILRDPRGVRIVNPSTGPTRLLFGPTMDCTVEVDPRGPQGLLLRDPNGIRILSPDSQRPPTLRFGPTDDCSLGIDPVLTGLLLRDPKGVRIAPTAAAGMPALPRLLFGPTDDCSLGIDPAFPGLVERDPIGFRLLGLNNQGCRLIFGPTMDCTIEVRPPGTPGAVAGLLLRDPSGIRLLSPDPQRPPILRFGPTDDCSLGIDPVVPGLIVRDPRGLSIAPASPNALPTLRFGPTDDCSIGISPSLPGLLLRDPRGIRIAPIAGAGTTALPRLLFGPTDDCSLGIDPAFPGLVERDPVGFRLLGLNNEGCRLIFGPTMDCTVEVDPRGPRGLLLRDPNGIRILSPSAQLPPTLRFGPTDDCSLGIDPVLTGLLLRDPKGVRIAPTAAAGTPALPRLLFGPTDDCSLGIDPAFPGLVERDPIGFRLLGQNNEGCRLIFGPTMDCTIEVQPSSNPESIAGLLLRDPRGIRILNPARTGPNTILFGPTDDCRITAPGPNGGMGFSDPRGFNFGSQVVVNGPVFAQNFVQTSSRRFKNDVKPIEQPLEKISKLQGVRFTWNEEKGGGKDIGFIAEEVAKVIPELVSWEEDGENARGVNYDHLVAVAIEGIKAQQTKIETLEHEKTKLTENLARMQAQLDRMARQLETLAAR